MATKLKLIANNDLGRFTREWRRNFAAGRIWYRCEEGTKARQRGDRDEEARQFLAASRIMS
jgi:hypothetical protein